MITNIKGCVACNAFDLVLTWDPILLNSKGNHEVVGVSSECKRSNCSSFNSHEMYVSCIPDGIPNYFGNQTWWSPILEIS